MDKNAKICIVGLGYVGLPLAALFSTKYEVIGFDVKQSRIQELSQGKDSTDEVKDIGRYPIQYTTDPARIKEADFIIVAVPTPVDNAKNPDLLPVLSASKIVGENLKRGSIVVYESTVYPGCTEDDCLPVLEKYSGLKCGSDFKIGYSPERVNPGDKEHTIDKIVKVVSGCDGETLDKIAEVYGSVITAGVHRASCIKVAEASKVIENVKRDLNIALVNELSLIFERLGISTREVLAAAGTKWNFNSGQYSPGLVGGHCIGVDPYYLTHKALALGYYPQVILAGRSINEYMSRHVAELVLKNLIRSNKILANCRVLVMGLTFKENVPDIRNSKVKDIIANLADYGFAVSGYDPLISVEDARKEFKVDNINFRNSPLKFDAVVIFSPHRQFKDISLSELYAKMNGDPVLIDIKGLYDRQAAEQAGFVYRTL